MESVLNLVVNAENVRVLLILVFGFSGFIWLKTSLEKKIVGVDKRIDELKYNDLAAIHKRIDGVEVSIKELSVALNGRIDEVEVTLNKRIDVLEVTLNRRIDEVEVTLNKRIDVLEVTLNKRIDEVETSLNGRIDVLEVTLNKRIDEVETSLNGRIDDLKHNDFAHLNSTIEALTYALEKNGSLKLEDKEYVDARLAR